MAHLVESLGKCDDCMMNQRARYFECTATELCKVQEYAAALIPL